MANSRLGLRTRPGVIRNYTQGSAGGDADANLFLEAALITDATISTAIQQLVIDLKEYGIWAKMKAIYPFVGGTAATHRWNLRDARSVDAAFYLDFFGGITHSSNGVLFNGSTGYANTKLVPSTSLTLNSTHISFYSRTTNIKNGARDFAVYENGDNPTMALGTNTGVYLSDHYNYNNRITGSIANAQGLFLGTRTSSTVHKLFRNGSQLGSTATTANTNNLPAQALYIGVENGGSVPSGGWSDKQCAFASIGDGLTDQEVSDLYTSVNTFQTTLSRNV